MSSKAEAEQALQLTAKASSTPTSSKKHGSSASMTGRNMSTGGAGGGGGGSVSIGTKPTLIEVKPMHFLIMDAPRQSNLHVYMKEMRKHNVHHTVRVCEPTYLAGELNNAGISLHEMGYQDGTSPAKELIDKWLQLVDQTFYSKQNPAAGAGAAAKNGTTAEQQQEECIAVHCVAGLGRAPVMVAIALIEFANMDPVEAVSFIRQRRRGAINEKQLLYLEGYKRQYRRAGAGGGGEAACCVIL
jgi:protein tyrosine phosphatase type 4A